FDAPAVSQTDPTGINNLGTIAGEIRTPSTVDGFVLSAGTYTVIDDPNAAPGSTAIQGSGINSAGQIVGNYTDPSGTSHGFLATPNTYSGTVQPPIAANGSSVFNANRGVVPVKFTLAVNGTPTCQLPAATISLNQISGNNPGPVNQSDFLQPSDSGVNFRIDSCQYVYNLGTSSLGPGSYLVQISINGGAVGSGTFGLR